MFSKATKTKSKLRMAIYGASGSGKTYSALSIAKGLSDSVAVIDTEHGSASKYADLFKFDVCELSDKSIDSYIKAINAASSQFDVLIIDSLSHAWQKLLDDVDRIAKAKYRGNSWSAWSEGTPMQRQLIEALLRCQCHVIATMRAKTEWVTNTNEKGRSAPVRVGLAPEQGKGIEYEFDFLASITPEHNLCFEKSRAQNFQDRIIAAPNQNLGEELKGWLEDGEKIELITDPQKEKLLALIETTNHTPKRAIETLTKTEANEFINMLKEKATKKDVSQ